MIYKNPTAEGRCQMARTLKEEAKYWKGSENFLILYEDDYVRVFNNPFGEIFVENIKSGVMMRISSYGLRGLKFTAEGRVEPVLINNAIGWSVTPR